MCPVFVEVYIPAADVVRRFAADVSPGYYIYYMQGDGFAQTDWRCYNGA